MDCKVSVIVPVYKVRERMLRTLECLKNQKFNEFEVILVDDGSPDDSSEFADNYLKDTDINYTIIRKENGGVSSARNTGIVKAKGKYITFLDSDDYIDEDMINVLYNKAEEQCADVIYCAYVYEDSNASEISNNKNNLEEKSYNGLEAAIGLAYGITYTHIMANMFKKELLIKNNIRFDTNRKFAEDISFMIKAYGYSKKVYCIDEIYAHYVKWNESVMNNITINYLDVYYSNIETLKYVQQNFESRELEKALITNRIPAAIVNIAAAFYTRKSLKKDLYEFLSDKKVRNELRKYRMVRFEKDRMKYLILSRMLLIAPKIVEKYYVRKK